ncbi:hypothetical protein [Sulfurimonas sp.]|uniref:hypothetical protein n=1 Tax=Sulfurimonas sp. TaxID=2022749 RepID=UPI002AAFA129|nr:hypothetical protein [Sulfurimonas sp.]
MTTISIINGTIIKDGRFVVPRECQVGVRVENVFDYFSKNAIDLDYKVHDGLVSVWTNNYYAKQKLIKALLEDKMIRPSQLLSA